MCCGSFPRRIDEYERMVTDNPVWQARTVGDRQADRGSKRWRWASPARCCAPRGLAFDYRKARPYSGYENYDFKVPTATEGDTYARYLVRVEEMRQSLRIIEQALENLPDGPVWTADRKMALPPRQELDTSMEAVIHHFKLMTEGFIAAQGRGVRVRRRARKARLGFYLVSDGTAIPTGCTCARRRSSTCRPPNTMARGGLIADLVVIIGTIDIVLGDVDR